MHLAESLVVALLGLSAGMAAAQGPAPRVPTPPGVTASPQPVPPPAEAYFEFMLARRLEAQGDSDKALAALKRAQALDPKSAEILDLVRAYARPRFP